MCGGSSSSSSAIQEQQQKTQMALDQGSKNIESAFSRFNQPFYEGVRQDYEKQQMPELGRQYRDTQRELEYKLADQGMARSSAADTMRGSLGTEFAKQQQGVVNTSQQAAQDLQSRVANQKAALYAQLSTSQNPTTAGAAALNTASQMSAPSIAAPLGQAFNSWANMYLANQNYKAANQESAYSPFLFNNNQSTGNYLGSLS